MAANTRTTPSTVQFAVGRHPALGTSETNLDAIFEQVDGIGAIHGEVVNHSRTENLVFAAQTGSTNIEANYATKQIRVNGSLVNSVTVAPLQVATFSIDGPNAAAVATKYWRFRASDQRKAFGTVSLTHANGELVMRRLFPT